MTAAAEAPPGDLRAPDGTRLRYRSWGVEHPRAHLLVSHGLGEHGGRYAALARDLAPAGIAVHALDHRGHGLSGGPRGHVRRFGAYVEDFEAFRRAVTAPLASGAPVFVLGQSLGGLIALRWMQTYPDAPVRGAVLVSPLLGIAMRAARWKVVLSSLLSRLAPALPEPSELDPDHLSTDPDAVRRYRDDPRVHGRITPRLYTEMAAAMAAAHEDRHRLRHPLLFLVPGDDRIVRSADALRLARALPGDVTVHEYPGFRHEPLHERERARAVAHVREWLCSRAS